jgi:hypothetical protein
VLWVVQQQAQHFAGGSDLTTAAGRNGLTLQQIAQSNTTTESTNSKTTETKHEQEKHTETETRQEQPAEPTQRHRKRNGATTAGRNGPALLRWFWVV